MSCQYCIHYAGLRLYCLKAHYVDTAIESINCDDFEIKREVEE